MKQYDFANILKRFDFTGKFLRIDPYGEGHINETFLAQFDENGKTVQYIVQRINSTLFTDVEKLMHNIRLVTEFNRKKVQERGGDPDREGLTLILSKEGESYVCENGDYFRVYLFITDATAYQIVEKPSDFYEAAVAFGNFANLLSEFDASKLYEVLPDFHNTEARYANFLNAVRLDTAGRAASVQKEIKWVQARADYCGRITRKLASGEIPLRVTHNDTKFNNVMIDNATGKAIAVIDLDTVMPGSLCYDFGDSIRFGCNPAAEDEPDLKKVQFQVPLFTEFAKGYLSAVGSSITQSEKDNLVTGALLMTFECGMRFLTDYLSGDTYFRTHRPGQNLDRTRTQFKLVEDIEQSYDKLCGIVAAL